MKNLYDLKQYLKTTAFSIKTNKPIVKAGPIDSTKEQIRAYWELSSIVSRMRRDFRSHLIAYCELRGMERERIEKPAENNLPNETEIKRLKTVYAPVWRFEDESIHTGS